VAVGDFNGDGKPDLAVANSSSNNVGVLLGNGDGTFQAAVHYAVGSGPRSVAVGDFNGDGKPDLAVANSDFISGIGSISVLLGNGDGTFQAAVNYAAGSRPASVAVGDFNGDGRPDLAVANLGNNVTILLNTTPGFGKAATSTTLTSSLNPSTLGQAVTLTATVTPSAGSGIPTGTVTFMDGADTIGSVPLNGAGQATLSIATLAGGAHTITAVYGGDSNFKDSTSSALIHTVGKAETATALNSSPNPSTLGQTVNFVATVTGQYGGGAITGTVIFIEGKGKVLGTASLVNGSATLSLSTLRRGWHRVRAIYGGDDNSNGSTSPAITQNVLRKAGEDDALPRL
jgi:hypothetical protein